MLFYKRAGQFEYQISWRYDNIRSLFQLSYFLQYFIFHDIKVEMELCTTPECAYGCINVFFLLWYIWIQLNQIFIYKSAWLKMISVVVVCSRSSRFFKTYLWLLRALHGLLPRVTGLQVIVIIYFTNRMFCMIKWVLFLFSVMLQNGVVGDGFIFNILHFLFLFA